MALNCESIKSANLKLILKGIKKKIMEKYWSLSSYYIFLLFGRAW